MRALFHVVIIILLIESLFSSCANPINPTGGTKDTIPPTLISSYPQDQSIQFKGKTITLLFDERIAADKLKTNLIITPITDLTYKSIIKKNALTIKFDQPFDDSTTYTLNFFDGITDITEKNPASNLSLAFSTGSYIDSLYVHGNVKDLFSNKPLDKVTIGLYKLTDTLDFQKNKPTYFTSTSESGVFKINNIKPANYMLFSFFDENRDLLFNAATEKFGIHSDTLFLKESQNDSINIKVLEINAATLNLVSARPNGLYFDVKYTKPIVNYILNDTINVPPNNLISEGETIRFYQTNISSDSIPAIIRAVDSLRNTSIDTVYVKFRSSSRKPAEYNITITPASNSSIRLPRKYTLNFNKPTTILDSAFLEIPIDSVLRITPDSIQYQFNNNRTKLRFILDITKERIQQEIETYLKQHQIDTSLTDSSQLVINQRLSSYNPTGFPLFIKKSSFVSADLDTSRAIQSIYKFANIINFGTVIINLQTTTPSYKVQIINNKKVIQSKWDCSTCSFNFLPPGEYTVRIQVDSNHDKYWSIGSYSLNQAPEPIVHFMEISTLRANWEIVLDYAF